jgi:hypothetical protein
MDLTALLGRGLIDPISLGERVFQELQDQLPSNGVFADISAKPPEELIATTLADWLARIIVNDDPATTADGSTVGSRKAEQAYRELSDRNVVLAAALGACDDCWGKNVDCPLCDGAGAPGWVLPDEQLYASYVYPAVRAVTGAQDSASSPEPKNRNCREE